MSPVNNATSSQLAYSYLQSKNKISGLVSGMDIESMMEKLMKAESAQMEKLQQQKQRYEWKRDAYRDVNTKLNTFQQNLFDKYSLKSSWNSNTANVSPNSSVNVKAGAGASGNLSISEVELAKAARGKFDSAKLSTIKVDETTKLTEIQGLTDNEKTQLETFAGPDATMKNLMDKLDGQGFKTTLTNGQLKISELNNEQKIPNDTRAVLETLGMQFNDAIQQSKTLKNTDDSLATKNSKLADLGLTTGKITLETTTDSGTTTKEIDLAEFASNPDATIDDLLKKIQDEGFNASIANGKLAISSKESNSKLNVTSDNTELNNAFSPFFKSGTSNTFVTNNPDLTSQPALKGTNTIQDLVGGGSSEIGSFTIKAIQADGTMKDTTISYKNTDTIDSLMKKINGSGAGVTALFSDGQFSISANNTGDNKEAPAEISLVSSLTDDQKAGMTQTEIDDWNTANQAGLNLFGKLTNSTNTNLAEDGSNASMTVNGVKYEQTSNVFNIAGYEITATGDLENTSSPITISSTPDADQAVDKVKSFVEMYNSMIKDLNTQTTEKKKVGYDPLTDAQKAEMSESQIEKWEETAKQGLLKGDSTLNGVISKMRQTLFTYGTSTAATSNGTALGIKGETLSSIGITTSKEWSDNGKLEIDEKKLREAIEKDPDILSRIFTGDGTKENPGVVSQMRTTAQDAIKTIEKSAGKATSVSDTSYSIGKTISSLDTKIADWKNRLKGIEDRYWSQFAAMENAIQKANSQSSIFMQ